MRVSTICVMTHNAALGEREKSIQRRCLHLLDIENLVGRPDPTAAEIAAVLVDYSVVSGRRVGDLVWVCCSSAWTMANIAMSSTGEGVACRRGRDGAELAIDDLLDWGWVARRFATVTFGSGDHYFAPRMALLASQGLHVKCIARGDSLSTANRLACHTVRLLPERPTSTYLGGVHDVA